MLRSKNLKNYREETKQFKKRVVKALILSLVLLSLIIIRLGNLQIFNHKLYADLATKNQLEHLPIEPKRGLIYDRNGTLIAENTPMFSLNIEANQIKNIKTTLEIIQSIIDLQPGDIKQLNKALKQRRVEQIPLKLKLTQEEVAAAYVNQKRLPGVFVDNQMIRHYPLANINANALGYVGKINKQDLKNIDSKNYNINSYIGKVGIEKYYENILRGTMGYKVVEVDATGRIVRTVKIIPPTAGENLYLTIDSKLQQTALEALEDNRGAAVAIDPNNGEILALVSNPSYDPNLFTAGIDNTTFAKLQLSSSKPMYNRATKGLSPFGSTIKPFIALQALDTGIITPNFKIFDPGWFKLENSNHPPYRDNTYSGHGTVDITKAITKSCNTFFYTIGVKLGIEKIDNILERFGFGSKINIDIAEESSGIVASPKNKMSRTGKRWYPGDTVISSIGQGDMSTTALQLAHGVAAIATHGKRLQPHLLLAKQKIDGPLIKKEKTELPPVILKNSHYWDIVIDAMKHVVLDPNGTAYYRFGPDPSYSVAGKTGGAQLYHHKIVNENPKPESEEKIPKHLRNNNLFIAFAPVENPKIAIAVITENSNKAVYVARKILDYYLSPNEQTTIETAEENLSED